MEEIILEARSLRKEFGGLVAVADVSLKVQRASVHAIIGPNGAGKTTFFNLLSGRYKATHGQVFFKGADITRVPFHQRALLGMGRSFQITNIFPALSVLENVRLAAQAQGRVNFRFLRHRNAYHDYIDRAQAMLDLVGLSSLAEVPASVLPHGGKRKLELAILLVADPELLLLDEPTAGMASEQVPELLATIDSIRQQSGKTIVLVEHNMNVVMNVSDRISVMNRGEMLAEGSPAEIAADQSVQQVYLGGLYGDFAQASGGAHG